MRLLFIFNFNETERELNIKKVCMTFGILFITIFVVDKISYFLIKQALSHSSYRFVDFYTGSNSADIIILGNSRADQNFPRLHYNDYKIINLGRGWAGVPLYTAMYLDYVESHSPPKVLVIETHFFDYAGTGRKQGIVQNVFSNRIAGAVSAEISYTEKVMREIIWCSRYNELNFVAAIGGIFLENTRNFISSKKVMDEKIIDFSKENSEKIFFMEQNRVLLKHLVQKLDLSRTRVLFVTTPVWGNTSDRFDNFEEFVAQIDKFSEELGIEHLNFSDWSDDMKYFADTTHLNQMGADRFSEDFFNRIAEDELSN